MDYVSAIRILLHGNEVDSIIVIYLNAGVASVEEVTRSIQDVLTEIRETQNFDRPVLACLMPDQSGLTLANSESLKLPCYAFPEAAAVVLGKMATYADWRSKPLGMIPNFHDMDLREGRRVCQEALAGRGEGWLSVEENRIVLERAGLPMSIGEVAKTADEATKIAAKIGFPVALKLVSTKLVHKTEVGGVHLNLSDEHSRPFGVGFPPMVNSMQWTAF
jgi:acyl-CoA synthetase (NDP forming)